MRGVKLNEAIKKYPIIKTYTTFGVIRHPIDRLESCWRNKVSPLHPLWLEHQLLYDAYQRLYDYPIGEDFQTFCAWLLSSPMGQDWMADEHYLSQYNWLLDADGTKPDFICKYENLDDDWRELALQIGLPHYELPHENVTDKTGDRAIQWPHLPSELLHQLEERYKEDYDLGGYTRIEKL